MKRMWLATAAVCAMLVPAAFGQAMGGHMAGERSGMNSTQGGAQIAPSKVYGDLLHVIQQEVVSAVEAMPEDKYDFRPTGGNFTGVRTFADQVRHLTEANYHFFAPFGMSATVPDHAKLASLKSKAELVEALKDSFNHAEAGINTMTPENAWTALTAGVHPQTRAGNAAFFMAHTMDIYGQIVEYLRMNGIVPPASQHANMPHRPSGR
jgi:uncharacterized damage-inducible protein DinB